MNGTAVKLEDVEDDVFSQKILGEGAALSRQRASFTLHATER